SSLRGRYCPAARRRRLGQRARSSSRYFTASSPPIFASRAQSSIRWGERQHLATEAKADADRWTEQPSPLLRTSNTSILTCSASAADRVCGGVAGSIGLDTVARIPTRREELMAGPKAHLLE